MTHFIDGIDVRKLFRRLHHQEIFENSLYCCEQKCISLIHDTFYKSLVYFDSLLTSLSDQLSKKPIYAIYNNMKCITLNYSISHRAIYAGKQEAYALDALKCLKC